MATSTIDDAVAACTAISIECAVRSVDVRSAPDNRSNLAHFDEYVAGGDAAAEVSA